ncbi:YihY/virulence factor BrkB family protein [Urechidicola vernalis]|uniref:YihY/virulence factor BrkB family protein n=1 Tax=Urechidicola vernalis TaxID=3075600 RepID=A0ABU2Y7R7_9FLAO|nr:YihY/virulence factor BrkB family protein [Urechidicola sp. P050]MDT0553871.1 YihY/virulence factor BrkB family protein [Urechidicola sp. P050]
MTKQIEDKLLKVPILDVLVKLGKKVKIPGLLGMSLYDLLEMYIIGIVKGALTSRAGAIAFSFFMALFPFLLFILTLLPIFAGRIEGFEEGFLLVLQELLPPTTSESVEMVINDIAVDITSNQYSGLLSFGFLASIFLMTNGVNAIFGGFEYSYHVRITRNIWRQYLVALGVSIVLSFLFLLTIAAMIYFELGMGDMEEHGWVQNDDIWIRVGRILFLTSMIYTSVTILYNFGTKGLKKRSYFSTGAVLTTLLTLLMFYLFGIYVESFAQYNKLYGSIGTLLILMLFVWLNSVILLLGFELNASMNRLKQKTKRDIK